MFEIEPAPGEIVDPDQVGLTVFGLIGITFPDLGVILINDTDGSLRGTVVRPDYLD